MENNLLLGFCLSLIALTFSWKVGFFEFRPHEWNRVTLLSLIGAFATYLSAVFLFEILVIKGLYPDKSGQIFQAWSTIFDVMAGFGALLLYSVYCGKRGGDVWGELHIAHFIKGVMSWLLAFPVVFFLGECASLLIKFFVPDVIETKQVAVQNIQSLLDYPLLFWSSGAVIFFLVPITEEILFRGFLHSWTKRLFGRKTALLATSVVFSLFHYSDLQGLANIQILFSLFVLSLFLGYLYEREHSLLAPIGLHCMFNFFSFMLILAGHG